MKSHGALKLQSMDYEATDGILMVFFWVWFLLKGNRLKTFCQLTSWLEGEHIAYSFNALT